METIKNLLEIAKDLLEILVLGLTAWKLKPKKKINASPGGGNNRLSPSGDIFIIAHRKQYEQERYQYFIGRPCSSKYP